MAKDEDTKESIHEIDTPSYRGPDRRKRRRADGADKPNGRAQSDEYGESIWAVAYADPRRWVDEDFDED